MRILVLGADGYLGWPTCMYFSQRGHEVIGVDNYFRRNAAREQNCEAIFPNPNLTQRAIVWKENTGKTINIHVGDVCNHYFLRSIFETYRPDAAIHYAEQPSAPYSMIDYERAAFTLKNNLMSTLNLIYAVNEFAPECHIIKLGTMGEYGTPNIDIEEGWIDIEHKGKRDRFLFPRQAGSLYHTTKIMDTDLLWFYVRTWGLRVTDLMQGPVYGISTDETDLDHRLMPNFHYDEIFGTVLNRFLVQAVVGYPLTVYGKGKQIRGYLNIEDTMQCVYLSAMQPAKSGELRIFNQVVEIFSVNQLAERVKAVGDKLGFRVDIAHVNNPRIEKEEHYYNPIFTRLLELGLKPHYLTDEVLEAMLKRVDQYKDNVNKDAISIGVEWKKSPTI